MTKSNFSFSDYADPEPKFRKPTATSAFMDKMSGLPVGKAFKVDGMSRNNLASRVHVYQTRNPGSRFTVTGTQDGKLQVHRIS